MKNTFTIVLDEQATEFLSKQGGDNPNAYITQLLEREKQRQGGSAQKQPLDVMNENTPNAST